MRNISLLISYDGTGYHGWQRQPNAITVEEVLSAGLERVLDHPVKLYAGARTDTGVHALGQRANLFTEKCIDLRGLARGVNSLLPPDIRIRDATEADDDFHSRYSAKSKTYVYTILNTEYNIPFYTRYVWHIPFRLDVPVMNRAVGTVIGSHDFAAFKKKEEQYKSTVRKVLRAGVRRRREFIYIVIEATGFLRYMVRNIVGTLMLAGIGKITAGDFVDILESGQREKAGPTAPAKGLLLKEIDY